MTASKSEQRVAIFMGGTSAEREVSLNSARMVMEALEGERYQVTSIDTGKPGWTADLLGARAPDVAVICLHGPGGEDGSLQGFLQTLGIPFIGSGVMSSALCMDKELTKVVLRADGIPVPQSLTFTAADRNRPGVDEIINALPLPLVVKPNRQGSTIGITKVTESAAALAAVDEALRLDTHVLLEEFVSGTEITACIIGGDDPEVLPLIEIVPQSGFYDYHDKYTPGATEEIVPARISKKRTEEARRYALAAHRRLRCWGMSRTDMIVAENGVWVLEVNTIPGMTSTSLLPRAAAAAGMSLGQLLDRLLELAFVRPEG